jgi:hypothetical protein
MTFDELKTAPLSILAKIALDTGADIGQRLEAFEALQARQSEIMDSWPSLSRDERKAIRRWSSLDANAMARLGFIAAL